MTRILTVTVGAPGSGKSTWARLQDGARRLVIDDYVQPPVARAWTSEEYERAKNRLLDDVQLVLAMVRPPEKHVIVDGANSDLALRRTLRKIASEYGYEAWLLDLRGLDVEQVRKQNRVRGNGCPDDVVVSIHRELREQAVEDEPWDGVHVVEPLLLLAEATNERIRTVHERRACPTCGVPRGERCVKKGTSEEDSVWAPRLKHPHEARWTQEVPKR